MQIQIEILKVDKAHVPNAKGGYQVAEVAYKDLKENKVSSKKVMSFTNKAVFGAASAAQTGEVYDVTMEKGDKYWEWTSMTKASPTAAGAAKLSAGGHAAPKSNYETAEERAAKQVYIVKQSSLSVAADLLSIGAKSPPNPDEVILLAQKFVDYVFSKPKGVEALIDTPNDLGDMPQ